MSQYYNLSPVYSVTGRIQANNALLHAQTPALIALTISGASGAAGTDKLTTFNYGSNYNGGETTFPAPYGGSSATDFYVRWTGPLVIPTAGTYTFYTDSDDGSLLGIDGSTVVFNNSSQGLNQQSGTIYLTAGLHAMTAIYNQGGGELRHECQHRRSRHQPGNDSRFHAANQWPLPCRPARQRPDRLAGNGPDGRLERRQHHLLRHDRRQRGHGAVAQGGRRHADAGGLEHLYRPDDRGRRHALATTTAALPGYGTSGKIVVASGMVLAVQPGNGTAGWNASQIDTLRASQLAEQHRGPRHRHDQRQFHLRQQHYRCPGAAG